MRPKWHTYGTVYHIHVFHCFFVFKRHHHFMTECIYSLLLFRHFIPKPCGPLKGSLQPIARCVLKIGPGHRWHYHRVVCGWDTRVPKMKGNGDFLALQVSATGQSWVGLTTTPGHPKSELRAISWHTATRSTRAHKSKTSNYFVYCVHIIYILYIVCIYIYIYDVQPVRLTSKSLIALVVCQH